MESTIFLIQYQAVKMFDIQIIQTTAYSNYSYRKESASLTNCFHDGRHITILLLVVFFSQYDFLTKPANNFVLSFKIALYHQLQSHLSLSLTNLSPTLHVQAQQPPQSRHSYMSTPSSLSTGITCLVFCFQLLLFV